MAQDNDFDMDFEADTGTDADMGTDIAKPNVPKREIVAKNDAYVGMLTVSLFALIAGCALLFLDFQKYDYKTKPPALADSAKAPAPESTTPATKGAQQSGQTNPPATQQNPAAQTPPAVAPKK